MSQHSLMTVRERKMQAAAICREIQGTGGAEMDLGRKVNTPKEIMLEELSLASNRGSRLFKMRQKRSERYTFESIQRETNVQVNNGAPHTETTDMNNDANGVGVDQAPTNPPNPPDPQNLSNPNLIAPGYGGPLKDVPAEKFNCTAVPKSYHSPWDQALSSDPSLAATLLLQMPEPEPKSQKTQYKSFNRVATPFGGFGSSSKAPVKSLAAVPSLPSHLPVEVPTDPVSTRPSFNRLALGWVSESDPLLLPAATLELNSSKMPMFIPESDEL
ncbi:myozenin-2a [Trichomycterus rosablanca]|uniref:myozenin-2a n=1 Tax=Trichomycterus rosablanca TaxID=2290929 RepID=UPI002F3594F2